MKNKSVITLAAFFLSAWNQTAMADGVSGTLSLQKALEDGLKESPTLKKYESSKDEADWGTTLGFSELVPHLSLVADHDFSTRYESVPVSLGSLTAAVPIVFPRTSYGVQANWTIFDGFANIRDYQASRAILRASQQEYSRKDFETRKKIEFAFFNALAAIRFREVAEENVKTLQENLAQVRSRFDAGRATRYDILRVEVNMSDANIELERTSDNVIIERKKLAQAMGLPEDERMLEGQLPEPKSSARVASLAKPDPSDRQDFEAAKFRSAAESDKASAALGRLAPAVGLKADYERYDDTDYPAQAYGGFRDAWAVGVYLRWNILDGGESVARAGIAKASAVHAQREYEEQVQSLPADFELWRRRYVYSSHAFETKEQDLTRSEESYRISQVAFQQGRNTITDVLEAENDLFKSRAGIIQSQLDAEEALINLELTIGKEI